MASISRDHTLPNRVQSSGDLVTNTTQCAFASYGKNLKEIKRGLMKVESKEM